MALNKKNLEAGAPGRINIKGQKKAIVGESGALGEIIKFLKKIPKSRLFRNYNTVPYNPGLGRFIRRSTDLTPKGLPDLIFHFRGKTVYFEVKSQEEFDKIMRNMAKYKTEISTKSCEHLKNQIRLIDDLNEIGINAFFICNSTQVDTHLQNIFGIDYLQ
jgi:hypothetical protein